MIVEGKKLYKVIAETVAYGYTASFYVLLTGATLFSAKDWETWLGSWNNVITTTVYSQVFIGHLVYAILSESCELWPPTFIKYWKEANKELMWTGLSSLNYVMIGIVGMRIEEEERHGRDNRDRKVVELARILIFLYFTYAIISFKLYATRKSRGIEKAQTNMTHQMSASMSMSLVYLASGISAMVSIGMQIQKITKTEDNFALTTFLALVNVGQMTATVVCTVQIVQVATNNNHKEVVSLLIRYVGRYVFEPFRRALAI